MKRPAIIAVILLALLLAGLTQPHLTQAGSCHRVRAGETVTSIAARYRVTVAALVQANRLSNPNLIFIGQCLTIPGASAPAKSCTITHVVRAGEFLKQIGARYGVGWWTIAQLNRLRNPNFIYPGQRLAIPAACQPKPVTAAGPWTAQFWTNASLSGDPKLTTHPKGVDYSWGAKGPGGGVPGTYFSARFTRDQSFETGTYRFRLRVDDGVRFWLDGILLIDQWTVTSVAEYTAERQLSSGLHRIQIDYYQAQGVALVSYASEKVDGARAWACQFYNGTGLEGQPVVTQTYEALNFEWGAKAPVAGVAADAFSVRCTAQFLFVGGRYQFRATADDGVRLYVDDALLIDQWRVSKAATYTADRDLTAGTHAVKVEHFENSGEAVLKAIWTQH